ncbi:MAG: redoxin domain-containing protein, partial [Blastocatellales bacterium]|nr:redoxin domain-containing protein [Blastocatellales bacterium]
MNETHPLREVLTEEKNMNLKVDPNELNTHIEHVERSQGKHNDLIFLLIILGVSLTLNVYLGWKIQRLSDNGSTMALSPAIGTMLPSIEARNLDNTLALINFEDVNLPTVLYIISPACYWCDRNMNNLKTLYISKSDKYRFLVLALNDVGIEEYVKKHELTLPIYKQVPRSTITQMGLGATPQTIVVSPKGVVLQNWRGAYDKALRQEVERYFGFPLPGVPAQ